MAQHTGHGSGRERRQHTRKPVALVINYETLDQFFEDYVTNISLGGVFVRSSQPLPIGTRLKVRFNLPDLDTPLETSAIVARVANPEEGDGVSGMGIRFDDLDEQGKALIDRMMNADHHLFD